MIQYLDDLEAILKSWNIKREDVILVGSCSLAYNNIRVNGDIEFVIEPEKYKSIPYRVRFKLLGWGHIPVGKNVDMFHNILLPFGITDKTLFYGRKYEEFQGWKVLKLEYEYLYKLFLLKYLNEREKDKKDIRLIEKKLLIRPKDNYKLNFKVLLFIRTKDFLRMMYYNVSVIIRRICRKGKKNESYN